MKAEYGLVYQLMVGLLVLPTLGLGYLIVLLMRGSWIDRVEGSQVVSRGGKSFELSQLTNREDIKAAALIAKGDSLRGVVVLMFGKDRIIVNPALVSNASAVVAHIGDQLEG